MQSSMALVNLRRQIERLGFRLGGSLVSLQLAICDLSGDGLYV